MPHGTYGPHPDPAAYGERRRTPSPFVMSANWNSMPAASSAVFTAMMVLNRGSTWELSSRRIALTDTIALSASSCCDQPRSLRLRRPDGRFLILETLLPDGDWGCDMLEDVEGRPDPQGFPMCYFLKLSADVLASYLRLDSNYGGVR